MLKCCPPDRMEQLRKTFFSGNCWNLSANVESEFLRSASLQPDHVLSKSKLPLPYTAEVVDCLWNVMAHAHKPDFFFRRNVRAHLTLSWPAGHIFPTYKESFQVRWDNSIPLFSPCCHLPWSISIPLNQSECIFPRNSRVQMILCAMLHADRECYIM